MAVVSSVILSQAAQIDQRVRVLEQHIDAVGSQFLINYLADAGADLAAALAAHATQIAANSITNEISQNIAAVTSLGSLAVVTFVYSGVAQNVAALRVAYKSASQIDAIMIGDFLSSLTDVQLQNAFGLTQLQVTTLRASKLTQAANAAAAIRAAVGA